MRTSPRMEVPLPRVGLIEAYVYQSNVAYCFDDSYQSCSNCSEHWFKVALILSNGSVIKDNMGSTLFLENVNELVRYVKPNVLKYVSLSLIDLNINIL